MGENTVLKAKHNNGTDGRVLKIDVYENELISSKVTTFVLILAGFGTPNDVRTALWDFVKVLNMCASKYLFCLAKSIVEC